MPPKAGKSAESRPTAALASELADLIGRAADATEKSKAELPRLEAARADVEASDTAAALEESEFQLKVYVARCDAAVRSAHGLASVLGDRACSLQTQNAVLEEEAQALRQRVAKLEAAHDQLPRGSGLDAVMAGVRTRPPQPHSSAAAAAAATSSGASGCRECGDSAALSCTHKELLATRVIDNTFDEYKRKLRQRLREADEELERLRSGAALLDEIAKRKAAEDKCAAMAKDFEAQRATWLKMIGAAGRIGAGDAAPASSSTTASASSLSSSCRQCAAHRHSLVVYDRLLQHATLMSYMREAGGDIKAFMLADAMAAASASGARSRTNSPTAHHPAPPPPRGQQPTQRTMQPGETRANRRTLVSNSPRGQESQPTGDADADNDGPSGVFRKPLHRRGNATGPTAGRR
jgi:hypothetical protein